MKHSQQPPPSPSGYKWTGLSTAFTFVLQIIQTGVLARFLKVEDFGLMAILYIIIRITDSFSDFGFGNILIQKQNLSHQVKSTLFWLILFSSFLLSLLLYWAAPLSLFFFKNLHPQFIPSLQLMSLTFILLSIGTPFKLHFQKLLRFNEIALSEIIGTLIGTITAISLAINGHGIYSLVIGFLLTTTFKSLILAVTHLKYWKPQFHFSLKDLQEHQRFGLFQLGEKGVNVLYSSIDKILTGSLLTSAHLGAYSIAYQMMGRPIILINTILNKVGFPLFSAIQDNPEKIRSTYLELLKFIALYIFPLCFGLFFVADYFFLVWLGPGWEESTHLFKILVFLGIFLGLSSPINNWMLGKGYVGLSFGLNVLGLVLNTGAVIIGSQYGIQGVAWGILFSMGIFMFILDLYLMKRYENISPQLILKTIAPFLLMALTMIGGLKLLQLFIYFEDPLLSLLFFGVTGASIYIGLVWTFYRNYLKSLLTRIFF